MNDVIITNLSTLHSDASEAVYQSDKGGISGIQTNDAPVKYLLRCLKEQGCTNSVRILAVTTAAAETAFSEFFQMVLKFTKEQGTELPRIEKIFMDEIRIAPAVSEIISNIGENDRVYIDTTGSFRNASYLLMVVVRILEYSGRSLEKVIYSNFHQKRIEDVTSLYKMYNLINAADSFTSFGNADGLMNFFQQKSPEISEVISSMNAFSEAVALCRTSSLDSILKTLVRNLNALEELKTDDENEILFKSISGVIRMKFGLDRQKKEIDYLDIIRWCLDNKQIQQAVTIYTEKIPALLLHRHAYTAEDAQKNAFSKDPAYDMEYKLFLEGLMTIIGKNALEMFLKHADAQDLKNLEKSQNSDDFQRRFKNHHQHAPEKELLNGLKDFFLIRNAMYDEFGNRFPEQKIKQNLKKYPGFDEFQSIQAKNISGFVSELCNGKSKLLSSLGENLATFQNVRINTIENFNRIHDVQNSYHILIPISHMQEIMRDYLYIKTWLRNSFNHASDETEHTPEEETYFHQFGYVTDLNPSLSEVTSMLRQAVGRLEFYLS